MNQRMFFLVFFLGLFLVGFISAISYDVSDAGVKVDKNIEGKFVYQSEVYVSVTIKDASGVIYNGTKEERHKQWEIQDAWYENKINEITSALTEEDFILYRKNPVSFSGLISKEGLEKMKGMEEIEAIELNYYGFANSVNSIFNLKWYIYLILILFIIFVVIIILNIKKKKNVKKK